MEAVQCPPCASAKDGFAAVANEVAAKGVEWLHLDTTSSTAAELARDVLGVRHVPTILLYKAKRSGAISLRPDDVLVGSDESKLRWWMNEQLALAPVETTTE